MAGRKQPSPVSTPVRGNTERNLFCKRSNLSNEASVENWFVDPLLAHLGFGPDDQLLKTSIRELKVGQGSRSSLYKPDYILMVNKFPTLVVDAKATNENIDDWASQCGSYCLELNKIYEHNPVEFFILSNGLRTALYRWDRGKPLVALDFSDFHTGNETFGELQALISKSSLKQVSRRKHDDLMESEFELSSVTLDEMSSIFTKVHQYIWDIEKKSPSAAFLELMKVVFVKIKKDRELREKLGPNGKPKVKDVVFSAAWIQRQTENANPINDPLFKNLMHDLEREIRDQDKRRIFDKDEDIHLSPGTIFRIVRDLEHIDFCRMDEDIHGRMFETFLDGTARGPELGQFFTPRDVVNLMVELADVQVGREKVECVLDACCGSGGFLIAAMARMLDKAQHLVGLSSAERRKLERVIRNESLIGIDAGSDPPIHRIARMNMYLHGDGGTNIYFADSLDKRIGLVGKSDLDIDAEILHLREMLLKNERRFDVILSNPPFSLKYSRDTPEQQQILNQYEIGGKAQAAKSLPSSVMFLERYKELVSETGRILAIIDDSILSGDSYAQIRDFIRDAFIVIGIVSLPGDAFRRADARVKTSLLIIRPKREGEEQGDVFMEKAAYLGLTPKVARRLGVTRKELEREIPKEYDRITSSFRKFQQGEDGKYVVPAARLNGRLDVKFCMGEQGRRKRFWKSKGFDVKRLDAVLTEVGSRDTKVDDSTEYTLLKVTYDGEVLEGDRLFGEDCSYRTLYRVEPWDILFSNMGIGRGAIGIVPVYMRGVYVSSEYTILQATTRLDAFYYCEMLRTKEILGDVLSSATGMNRGRIRWSDMRSIDVPVRSSDDKGVADAVRALESRWDAQAELINRAKNYLSTLSARLRLNEIDSRVRWLAFKPPE